MKRKATKATAGFLAAAMLANGCMPKQASTWKTESVVEVKAEKIEEVKEPQVQYYISSEVYENGKVEIHVAKNTSQVTYELSQTIRLEKQRKFYHGKSRAAAIVGVGGLTGIGTALVLRNNIITESKDCAVWNSDDWMDATYHDYCVEYEQRKGSVAIDIAGITSGVVAISGFIGYANSKNKERPTTHYRTEKVPMGEVHKTEKERILTSTAPAFNAVPVTVSSAYFIVDGSSDVFYTNENGDVEVQLEPTNPRFAFSVDAIANTDIAQQLRAAGYSDAQFMPLLQQAAVPISYDLSIVTRAEDGKNAIVSIPVKGCEIPQKALEKIVMELEL